MQHARTHAEHHTRKYTIHIDTHEYTYILELVYIHDYFLINLVSYIYINIYKSPKIPWQ